MHTQRLRSIQGDSSTSVTPKFSKLLMLNQRTLTSLATKVEIPRFESHTQCIEHITITISGDPTNRYPSKHLSTLFSLFTQPSSLSVSFSYPAVLIFFYLATSLQFHLPPINHTTPNFIHPNTSLRCVHNLHSILHPLN